MSASDMAKLGQLCLQNGVWNGKQIVFAKWIAEMLTPRKIESGRFRGMHYGYPWWIVHPERNIYAAVGDSGNIIYVDSNRNTVVAVSSYFKPKVLDRVEWIETVFLPMLFDGNKNYNKQRGLEKIKDGELRIFNALVIGSHILLLQVSESCIPFLIFWYCI